MSEILRGRVQAGVGDAARWLSRFNAAYSRKLGMPVFPGSLNLKLDQDFDWTTPRAHLVRFGREEYGGDRDILLLPCTLRNLLGHRAFLWTTTTPKTGPERVVLEVLADVKLREAYVLVDGSLVEVELPTSSPPFNHLQL